ncbi:MAG: DNA-binding response regulator [Nitrospirae bacterium GWD2_57_9]|nr:MAG: DNA-binding response regulator [Nitrospirae bacterium GWD2_57_9]OGW49005.1 MAG: DNA-binding response regulator [Nitrospirae bacterium GWC2_57_9]
MKTISILVIDDEPDLVELVSYNLRKEGFKVSTAANGEDGLEKIRKGTFDLLILDLMLPGVQGVEVCRMVRSNPKTESLPIIMLTAKTDMSDKIKGLETGADDYMTKPFSPSELVARVRALLRRTARGEVTEKTIQVGDLTIYAETYTATKRNKPVHLSATEFKLLLFLAERRGRVFSRDQLLDAVWKDEAFVEPRTVDVHIRRLRTAIEDDPAEPVFVKTRRGVGYYVE